MQEQNTNYTPPVDKKTLPASATPKALQAGIPPFIGIAIIIVVAAILFGGVFAYQYFAGESGQNSEFFGSSQKTNQTQTQTAGWKTYTNTQYGFSIKYPTNGSFTADDAIGNNGQGILFTIPSGKMEVRAMKNTDAYISGTNTPICYNTAVGSDPWQKTLNGINFTVFNYGKYVDGSGTRYCVWQNGIVYILIPQIKSIAGIQTPDVNKDVVFNQMLSTFTITK